MLSKSGSNAWNSKSKLLRNDQDFKNEKWPELGKSKVFKSEDANDMWPELGKSKVFKSEYDNGNRGNASGHYVDGRQKVKEEGPFIDVKESTIGYLPEKKNESAIKLSFQNNVDKLTLKQLKTFNSPDTSENTKSPVTTENEEMSRSNKEEKKIAHKKFIKAKKEALRHEKQIKKEEDILRKMVGPKGLNVTLIDTDTFSKFAKAEVEHTASTMSYQQESSSLTDMQFDSTAFPELSLGAKRSNGKFPGKSGNRKILNSTTGAKNYALITKCERSTIDIGNKVEDANKPKSRRKKDPIVVDILKAIEICNLDKKSTKMNVNENISLSKNKEKNSSQIVGNLLDSSNPLRHRGKKREVPRKRHATRLKKAIMAERERRRRQRELKILDTKGEIDFSVNHSEIKCESEITNPEFVVPYKPEVSQPLSEYNESVCVQKINVGDLSNDLNGNFEEKCLQRLVDKETTNATTEVIDVDSMVRETLHSKKHREYCNHSKSKELSEAVKLMLQDIIRFQDRLYANQPLKAESHRRYVVGLRQTQNLLSVRKVKVIVMAPDMEKVPSPGGLDDLVNSIIDTAKKQNVPVVFPIQRRQLGKVTYRKVGVSCVGILNYQGTESNYQRMIVGLEDAKKDYQEKFEKEKSRIINEFGLLNLKKEEKEPDVVQPPMVEPVVTLPLLQKLSEAISEMSFQSTSQRTVSDDIL